MVTREVVAYRERPFAQFACLRDVAKVDIAPPGRISIEPRLADSRNVLRSAYARRDSSSPPHAQSRNRALRCRRAGSGGQRDCGSGRLYRSTTSRTARLRSRRDFHAGPTNAVTSAPISLQRHDQGGDHRSRLQHHVIGLARQAAQSPRCNATSRWRGGSRNRMIAAATRTRQSPFAALSLWTKAIAEIAAGPGESAGMFPVDPAQGGAAISIGSWKRPSISRSRTREKTSSTSSSV